MQNRLRGRPRTDRLALIEEEDQARSPSYFEWCERTARTQAFKPAPKPEPKRNAIVRLFRLFM
ncbi:MAG TPA: hypothetical protein VGD45_11175 [Steroidobacter sp.]|uniref:hypothetical protein n=1 Tax=Steroidobacter sp. TaxID=1978227 RepID=UPI002ED89D93